MIFSLSSLDCLSPDDFVKGLINKQQAGRNGARSFSFMDIVKISSVTAPVIPNSDAVSSSTSNKVRKREHSLGGDETVQSACFSGTHYL